jgi:hypothetical protein
MNWTGSNTEASVATAWQSAITNLVNGSSPTGIASLMNTEVTWTQTIVSTVNATWHQQTATKTTLTGVAGTAAAVSLPWRMAPIVRFNTALANRRQHGRVRLPPFCVTEMAAHGRMTSGAQTQLEAAFEACRQAMLTAGLTQVIFGTKAAKDGTPAYTLSTVTGISVLDTYGSQRKRDHKLIPNLSSGA